MRWIIPKRCRDQEIAPRVDRQSEGRLSVDFNAPLLENDGGVCVADAGVESLTECGQNTADDDIRKGEVKSFDNLDDLIASLKRPW